ncbi:MAG TPA: aminotransferase class I/II-fold pyridoxal phosphate-dependent enzyme, partial [Thermodesulfobacteriota bacterium]|nr:aminotransferase class I/II-fold pyridoxal phosphate-dependent enzyme [Thermodesulfobacteriota bacterium]
NYLGLSYHPEVIKAGEKALKKYGGSSVGAPMHTGTYDVHVKLEKKLAEIKGCEEIMLFPSGYTANLGVISGLIMKDDVAILDRLAHRSILDGVALSGATMRTFRHSDMNDLQRVLKSCESKYNGKVIIVDGVYSTEGDICPLPEIVELGKKYDAKVMVDDAHAMGIIGENGRGTISHFGMEGEVDIVVGTMSKALGCVGGFVGASKEVINYLRHYGRSSVFSCNLPPQVAASALKSIEIMENEPEKIETLMKNVNYVREKLEALGFNLLDFYSAIVVVIIGNDVIGKKMAAKILEEGIYLSYFPYPAVPVGKERLRLTVMSTHTKEDLDKTIEILERVGKEYGVIDENSATDKNISSAA